MRRVLKWFVIGLLVLLLLILLLLGGLWFLAGTDSGFKLTTREISKRVEGLELGAITGSLNGGIATDALSFENDALKIEARGVDSEWRLSCLKQREFCLDRVVVDELDVTTFAVEQADASEPAGDIALPDIQLPIDVTVQDILVKQLTFQPPGEVAPQVLKNIHLSARTDDGSLLLDDASVDYATYSARLNGRVTPEGDYPLELDLALTLDDVIPDGEGFGEQRDVRVDVALDNTLADLVVDTVVSGPVELTLTGRLKPLRKDLPAAIRLDVPVAGWPLDTRAIAKVDALSVTIDGTLDDYMLTLGAQASGEQVPETTLNIAGVANTERLLLDDIDIGTLDGTVDGQAAVSWKDGLFWLTALDVEGIDPSLQIETLAGELDATLRASGGIDEDGEWTLAVREAHVEGVLQQYPFELDALVGRGDDGLFRIDSLTLDNGDNRVNARGTVGEEWDIDAKIQLPQLQNFVPGLAGGFTADIVLSGPVEEPSVLLDASTTALKLNDLVVQGLSVKGDIARAGLESSTLTLAIGQIQQGTTRLANLRLGIDGTRQEHQLAFFVDGPEATAVDLTVSGGLSDSLDWLGTLEDVELELPAHEVKLAAPTALSWKNDEAAFTVDPHCWTTEGTSLCLENQVIAAASGTAVVSLDQYPLGRLNPFLPAETTLDGTLGADSTVTWGEEQPGGFAATLALVIDDGGATVVDANEEPVSFAYTQLTLDADVDPTDVEATLSVNSRAMGDANVSVQLDPSDETRALTGRVDLSGFKIDFLKAFLPDFETISGTVNAAGDLSGALTDPRFDGEIELANPVVKGDALPLPINGGNITTTVKGKRAFIVGELDSTNDGTIEIEGSANWQRIEAWRADVTLIGSDLEVRADPLTDSRVAHEITIGARPGSVRVDGRVDVPFARINVAELPQGAATLSNDIVVIEDVDENASEESAGPASDLDLRVNVEVSLGDDVALDAYGLTANLTGDMSVSLRSPDPVQLGGEIKVVDGIFKQYGQNLEASGQIIFVGPVDRTSLDIEAIRRIDTEEPERIAGLKITGDIAEPDIGLFTEPGDKSEEAILSYVVLGRDIGEASDQSASLLASAALALSVKGGRTIGAGVADRLGIDEFALETRGRGDDTELVVSGRLNDRLLLSYGQNVFDSSGQSTLTIRYDLTKKLYLEAIDGANTAVDLIYSFSF